MSDGLVVDIARGWRDPRGAMARRTAAGLSETSALRDLFLACAIAFVASTPNAVRGARALDIEDAVAGVVSAHLFGYFFVAPLLLYGVAAVLHLAARVVGGGADYLAARTAVFWAALLGAPIALALALAGVAVESLWGPSLLPLLDYLVYSGFAVWLWLLAATFAEAEGFGATYGVAAAFVLAGVTTAAGVRMLSRLGGAGG